VEERRKLPTEVWASEAPKPLAFWGFLGAIHVIVSYQFYTI